MVETGERLRYDEQPDSRRHQLDGVRRGGGTLVGRPPRAFLPVEDVVEGCSTMSSSRSAAGTSSTDAMMWSFGITTTVVSA